MSTGGSASADVDINDAKKPEITVPRTMAPPRLNFAIPILLFSRCCLEQFAGPRGPIDAFVSLD
jgi:hypothetical protein